MKKTILIITLIFMLLVSIAAIIYPVFSNYMADKHQSEILTDYRGQVEDTNTETLQEALQAVKQYNSALLSGGVLEDYDDLLNISGNGIMGYVVIPSINVELPIYHGTQSLELGAVHLQGTSLPIGGKNTHTSISAHSGMTTQRMFTDLEQMVIGDVFSLQILDQTLYYEVDQIQTVLPDNTAPLQVVPGEELCTLLTCTPYGVNTHRLLVRGHRIEVTDDMPLPEGNAETQEMSYWMQEYLRGLLVGLAIVAALAVTGGIIYRIRRKRREK